jgi:aliphatic sulfonates family ABC transporter substrate-binding protein
MTNDINRRAVVQALGAFGALAATPWLSTVSRAEGAAAAPLNLGYQNTSWGIVAMVGESEKTFQKAGANVKTYMFDGGKSTRDAMIANRVDIGVLGVAPFIVGAAKGDIYAIAVAMYAAKTNAIVAGKDSGIKTIADLKGKRVASQLGSATHAVFVEKILPKYGLSKNDVQIVNVPHQNAIAALVGKSVDAFAGVEPFPSVAEVEGLGYVLLDYSEFDLQPVFLAINKPVLDSKREAVVAFMRGWLEAGRIVREEPERAVRIVAAHFKGQGYDLQETVVRRMLTKIDVTPTFQTALKPYLVAESKSMMRQHQIPASPDWDKRLDGSVLAAAMHT